MQTIFNLAFLGLILFSYVEINKRIDVLDEAAADAIAYLDARANLQRQRAEEIEAAIGMKRVNGEVQ